MNFVIYKFVFYFLVLWFRRYFHVPAENQIETRQFYYDIVTCLLFIPREKKKRFMNNRTFYQVIFHTRISFCMYLETKTKNACSEIKQPLFRNGGKSFFFCSGPHFRVPEPVDCISFKFYRITNVFQTNGQGFQLFSQWK